MKENKLVKKVKCLLKRLGCPRWLHHFGPKKYEFYQHLCALLFRHLCRLSYRRVVKLFDLLGLVCASKSALQYTAKHMPKWIWDNALQSTAGAMHHIIALDSTCFSRTHPSYHYLRRIDGKIPIVPVKLSATFDTKKKKWCSAKIRVLPAHDIKDACASLKNIKTNIFVADKGYDANSLHMFCNEQNIEAHIPMRNYGKSKHHNWSARRKAALHFRTRTYHRRVLIESGFSSLKRKFGDSVSSKKIKTVKAELYGRLLAHNLFGCFKRFRTEVVRLKKHNLNSKNLTSSTQ